MPRFWLADILGNIHPGFLAFAENARLPSKRKL